MKPNGRHYVLPDTRSSYFRTIRAPGRCSLGSTPSFSARGSANDGFGDIPTGNLVGHGAANGLCCRTARMMFCAFALLVGAMRTPLSSISHTRTKVLTDLQRFHHQTPPSLLHGLGLLPKFFPS